MGGVALAFMDVAIALAGIALKTLGLHNVAHIEQSRDLIAFRMTSNASFANNSYNITWYLVSYQVSVSWFCSRWWQLFFFLLTTCCSYNSWSETCIKFILFFSYNNLISMIPSFLRSIPGNLINVWFFLSSDLQCYIYAIVKRKKNNIDEE